MTDILWGSDCCQCRLIMEIIPPSVNLRFVDSIQKCRLHINLFDQSYLDAVMAHCRSFSAPRNPTAQEKAQNQIDKRNERERILAMGDPIRDV